MVKNLPAPVLADTPTPRLISEAQAEARESTSPEGGETALGTDYSRGGQFISKHCQHEWEIASYRGKLEYDDRPEFVLMRCSKCNAELIEDFN